MKLITILLPLLLISISSTTSEAIHEEFMHCMLTQSIVPFTKSVEIIFTPNSSLYSFVLQSNQQNPRFSNSSSALKPVLIITPFHEYEIQRAIFCSKNHNLQIRIRSGGHDYEGLSFLCSTPFIIIDLVNLRSIEISLEDETAWVQSGATLGELYYAIGKKSRSLAFPAGICPTVGVGGHFSGGGFGTLLRKHGLAADNILDAYLVDANGRILNRATMGEELFWAIRGGGGASFGVILSWKIKLVRVQEIVTVFTVSKTLQHGATHLVHKWQSIAHNLPEDLFIRTIIQNVGGNNKTIQASFNSLFLGGINTLMKLMDQTFPELGLTAEDCFEMSWVESAVYFAGYQKGQPPEVLLDKTQLYKSNFKAKSDFVPEPIPADVLEGIWERFLNHDATVLMILDPFGGKMNEIHENEVPFPHRKGNLYNIQYLVKWDEEGLEATNKHINWIRMLYKYMRPYVSRSPRTAYLNYRDLDLGSNELANISYSEAIVWGVKYFKANYRRLARVKSMIDPKNFFKNEQGIPPLPRKMQAKQT